MSVQRAAFWRGARESIGAPIAVIAANYLGLGAFASATAVSVSAIVVSTFTIWALPGQLVMVDMWMVGAPAVAVLLAVMLTNVRFLPMSITIMPVMRDPAHPRWLYYVTAHFIAMTSWVVCMPRLQQMPTVERIAYFIGFSLTCIVVGAIFGALGYYAAAAIPAAVQLGLIFLTPIIFSCCWPARCASAWAPWRWSAAPLPGRCSIWSHPNGAWSSPAWLAARSPLGLIN